MTTLAFLTSFHFFLNPAFANFAVSALTSMPQHPVPLPPTSIVHSKLGYCNSLR